MSITQLSVFFPFVNEEANITSTVLKALGVLKKLDLKKYEIILVDDGSLDKSGEIADQLALKCPEIRVIHQENGGYGCALKTGFYNAKFDWVVYTDSDGQFDFSEVDKFIEKTDSSDLIYGYRLKRQDHFLRLVTAKGWALSLFLFFGLQMKDVDCGFKMISKKVLDKIAPLESTRGGMINAEIVIKAKQNKFKIVQVGVNHYPRLAGNPTGVHLRVIIQSYIDLFRLWMKINFQK